MKRGIRGTVAVRIIIILREKRGNRHGREEGSIRAGKREKKRG